MGVVCLFSRPVLIHGHVKAAASNSASPHQGFSTTVQHFRLQGACSSQFCQARTLLQGELFFFYLFFILWPHLSNFQGQWEISAPYYRILPRKFTGCSAWCCQLNTEVIMHNL